MDSDILQAMSKESDCAFYKYKHEKSEDSFNSFKLSRNRVQHLVQSAKKDYVTNSVETNKNNSKSLWKTLKSLGLPSKLELSL